MNRRNILLSMSKKLRKLAASNERISQRNYNFLDIRKAMEDVIPEMLQQQKDTNNQTYSQREQRLLEQLIQMGVFFSENGKYLNRVNNQLADMITTLGKVLQGINI